VVGPVSRIVPWGDVPLMSDDAAADCEQVRAKLEKLCLHPRPLGPDQDRAYQVLINLEFLMDTPWMGREQWKSKTFVLEPRHLPWVAGVQIVPVWTVEGLSAKVEYQQEATAITLAGKVIGLLEDQIATVARETNSMARAELFWNEELGSQRQSPGDVPLEKESLPGLFEVSEIDLSDVGIDLPSSGDTNYLSCAVVAAYDLLLAKLNLAAAPQLVLLHPDEERLEPVPVRLLRTGNPKGEDFIQIAAQKIALAAEHSQRSHSIYRKSPLSGSIRHGCILRSESSVHAAITDLVNQNAPWLRSLTTVLDVCKENPLRPRLFYRPGVINRDTIEEVSVSLPAILRRLLEQGQIRIADVLWNNVELAALETVTSIPEMSHEFQFND